MYAHTQSFFILRDQTQTVLDFAVLISNSVPLQKMTIKKIEKGVEGIQLAKPDYFKGDPNQDQLKEYAKNYKVNLSKYVLLSNFSYFEAYITNSIQEIFEFHGGYKAMVKASQTRSNKHIDSDDEKVVDARRRLQDSFDKKNEQKYRKYTQILKKQNYKFPSELLSSYGVIKLNEELKSLRSEGIPAILSNGLNFSISKKEISEFHRIRDFRNGIAHGKLKDFTMPTAMECNRFLRNLSVRIDNHIVTNFFIIEKFT